MAPKAYHDFLGFLTGKTWRNRTRKFSERNFCRSIKKSWKSRTFLQKISV